MMFRLLLENTKILSNTFYNGKQWDEEITVLFNVLWTCEDDQFITAIKSKEIEYLAGKFTDIHHLTSFAIAIYSNLQAKEIWMRPDKKSVQIAALMTQVKTFKKNIAAGGSGAAYTMDSTGGQPGNSFKRPDLQNGTADIEALSNQGF